MSLLLDVDRWAERRAIAAGPLAPLLDSLAAELAPVVARAEAGTLEVPTGKALLSRTGGRCPTDGELLDFDPFDAHAHRCPRCGVVWRGEWHDRYRPYWYQLWLAERALQGALLFRLRGDDRHRGLARWILEAYADAYLQYPNRDNVLGPSRPFFSTYLESIWLLQLVLATDLLGEADPDRTLVGLVRERIVEPSAALIAGYDEGMSNRQVWNNAALLAARTSLGDPRAAERALGGASGVIAHLEHALLPDGTWYEGENYHLFAHRGLWYAVTMLETQGIALPAPLLRRFDEGFAAPFLTALPDLTFPSRRDSQYAIAIRQPRFAELCELGLARRDDDRLTGLLHRLYSGEGPAGDTGRSRSTADVERNRPGTSLTRADLGWRALLHARAELPADPGSSIGSVLLEAQGIAVFRRERNRRYVALDYGHSGGGHGHPDRLNLLVADGPTRWLDDMGTGSYVDRSLHWYRSTLAHNAPLVDGRSQRRVHGVLLAHEERGGAGWVRARAAISDAVVAERTVVVLDGYLLDRLEWRCAHEVTLDLPIHADGETSAAMTWRAGTLSGGDGTEDGFDFVRDAEVAHLEAGGGVGLRAVRDGAALLLVSCCDRAAEWWRASAPGAPGLGEHRFHLLRARGSTGRIDTVVVLDDSVLEMWWEGNVVRVLLADGAEHRHAPAESGWHIDLLAAGARSSIDLGGLRRQDAPSRPPAPARAGSVGAVGPELPVTDVRGWLGDASHAGALRLELGRDAYLRSEPTWEEAGRPAAVVTLAWDGAALVIEAEVAKSGELTLVPAGAENPYDNEPAEINGDGVQLYVRTSHGAGAWIIVPEPGGTARARRVDGWSDLEVEDTRWRRTPRGYTLRARVPLAGAAECLADVVVNDVEPGRMRRRGQLVLSGGGGFVYLRGDRHPTGRMLALRLAPHRSLA